MVRPGGSALFYAWALEQREFESRSGHRFQTSDVLVPFHLRTHGAYFDDSTLQLAPTHALEDKEKKAVVLQRYCHVYAKNELESLIMQLESDQIAITDAYYDQGNWAVVVTKKAAS